MVQQILIRFTIQHIKNFLIMFPLISFPLRSAFRKFAFGVGVTRLLSEGPRNALNITGKTFLCP